MRYGATIIHVISFTLAIACGGTTAPRKSDASGGDGGEPAGPTRAGSGGQDVSSGAGAGARAGSTGVSVGGSGSVGTGGAIGGSESSSTGGSAAGGSNSSFLPPGCMPRGSMASDRSCSLSAFCGSAPYVADCSLTSDDIWQCSCAPRYPDRRYEIVGAKGLDACAVALGACGAPDEAFGAEVCEERRPRNDGESCSVSLACGRPLRTVAAGSEAWLMRYGYLECATTPRGGFDCGCRYLPTTMAGRFDASTGSSAPECSLLGEFCMRESGPARSDEPTCLLTRQVQNAEGCERFDFCSQPESVSDPSVPPIGGRYANCTPKAGGGFSCYCSTRDVIFTFDTSDAPAKSTCDDTSENCKTTAVIEPLGDVSCESPQGSALGEYGCYADLACTQAASVDGRPIVAIGRLMVTCRKDAPELPWACSCASDQQTARFVLEQSNISADEACSLAPAACQEHIPVHLGPYGSAVSPPDP